MEKTHSAKFLRQRKMMMVLPLLVLPFVTMAFWALGGGKSSNSEQDTNENAGLNLQLPNANLKSDKNEDKLSFYIQADADSLKRAESLRADPYFKDSIRARASLMDITQNLNNPSLSRAGLNASLNRNDADLNEQKIYERIDQINKQINSPEPPAQFANRRTEYNAKAQDEQFSNNIDRMQEMMHLMSDKETADTEMEQLNGTLDKILDIQHPQRVADKIKNESEQHKEIVYSVSATMSNNNINLLTTMKDTIIPDIQFYGLSDDADSLKASGAIQAVVHTNQTLVNGSIVKLRLASDIYINGIMIPKGNFVYGVSSLNGERLQIEINSIRYGTSLLPVKLQVYDLDGLKGIYIPGAITRDVAKQSADNSLQMMDISSFDPSIKAQATAAGISTAKSLLSKKVKLIKVQVKEGYKVLLKNNDN